MKKVTLSVFALSLVFLATGCGDSPDSVMKDMIKLMNEATEALESAKDSPDKAKSKLDDVATKMEKVAERAKKIGKLDKNKKEALEKKYKSEGEEAGKKFQAALKKLPPDAVKDLVAPMLKFTVALAEVGKALGMEEK